MGQEPRLVLADVEGYRGAWSGNLRVRIGDRETSPVARVHWGTHGHYNPADLSFEAELYGVTPAALVLVLRTIEDVHYGPIDRAEELFSSEDSGATWRRADARARERVAGLAPVDRLGRAK